jgi:hypothetical protein
MSASLANTDKNAAPLARPLHALVPLIQKEIEAGDAAGIEHYRRAGEMLLEAKEQCERGEWTAWVERNFHLSDKTAWRYMKLAESPNPRARGNETVSRQTLSSVTDSGREPSHRPAWQAPVQRIAQSVDLQRYAADEQKRRGEAQLIHDLAYKLIDIGFKVLASKLHPDKGGSHEAMARLNKVKTLLKGAI